MNNQLKIHHEFLCVLFKIKANLFTDRNHKRCCLGGLYKLVMFLVEILAINTFHHMFVCMLKSFLRAKETTCSYFILISVAHRNVHTSFITGKDLCRLMTLIAVKHQDCA